MSVIRIRHQNNYVVLNKEVLEHPNLTLKAKGLWAFCMAKPDNWEFHLSQLQHTLIEGRTAITNAINELIKFGFCLRIQRKDEYGQWATCDYEVYETAQIKKCLPICENPLADNRLAENQLLLSNNKELNNNKEREEDKPLTPTFSFLRVSMSQDKYDKLIFDFGTDKVNEMLNRLDEYADINPKRFKQYACHATVIRKWIREDIEKVSKKPYNQVSNDQVTQDKALAEIIVSRVQGTRDSENISIGHDYIEFRRGMHTTVIKFGDKGFREQCINALRKMGLTLQDV